MAAGESVNRPASMSYREMRRPVQADRMNPNQSNLVNYAACNSYQLSDKSSIPIYYQLFRLCRRYIIESRLHPGDRFPSEQTIARSFEISRATAHRAIHELLARRFLMRQRGRGTFVAERTYAELTLLSGEVSFSDQYIGRGQLSSRIIDRCQCPASWEIADALRTSETEPVHRLRRLRCIDERPFLLEESYLSVSRFPGLDSRELLKGSLAATLLNIYETPIARCDRWFEASDALGQDTATHLQISVLSPILLLHGVGYTDSNIPVVYMQAYIREGVSFRSLDRPHSSDSSPKISRSPVDSD